MKHNMEQLKECYLRVFDSASGKTVLADLERVTNQTRITADAPDPHSAIFKIAQQQLLQRIRNMMEQTETKSNLTTGEKHD